MSILKQVKRSYYELAEENQELREIIKQLRKEKEDLANKIVQLKRRKGEREQLILTLEGDYWHIKNPQDKTHKGSYTIPEDNVVNLDRIITNNVLIGETISFRELVPLIINEYNLELNVEEFFGTRKEYREKYYFPVRILEHIGSIKYSRNGVITRLK